MLIFSRSTTVSFPFICSMWVVFGIFIGAAVIQVLYYTIVFSRAAMGHERHYEPDSYPPVSIVICAKNEAENLKKNLKVILIQNYPVFEVIIVNDQSTDHTLDMLAEYFQRNDNLRLFNIKQGEKPIAGKKFALKTGVENAQYDIIVTTDADCKPFSAHWLEHLVGSYLSDTDFVLGYAPFYKEPTFINKVARYENVMTAMLYFSFARVGMPYMGVGRNMAFRKNAFMNWNNYEESKHLPSGDDDLLVNALASKKNTELCLNRDSFVYSAAKTNWGDWLHQKTRHAGSGRYYRFHHLLLLTLFSLTHLLFYTTFIVLCIKAFILPVVLIGCALTLFVKYWITGKLNAKLQQNDLNSWFFLLDPIYIISVFCIFILSLTSSNKAWK